MLFDDLDQSEHNVHFGCFAIATIPTIATMVPRGGFSWVTKKMKGEVSVPLITTNRINMPGLFPARF